MQNYHISPEDSNTAIIPLSKGKVALVDTSDAIELCKRSWYAGWSGSSWYAATTIIIEGKKKKVYMHKYILQTSNLVDHINCDTLNNKRENLREVNAEQSAANRRSKLNSSSEYKGVSRIRAGTYQVMFRGKYVGIFYNEIEAAKAYDKIHKEIDGEFANLNFPNATN